MAQRKSKYARKHGLQLKGIFGDASPLPNYRMITIKLSNGFEVKIKSAT